MKSTIIADLHIHSNYSDGRNTLEEIVEMAKIAKLKTLSLTDHDSVDGIEKITTLAKENAIEVIPGVEISTSVSGVRIHILGYGIDIHNPELKKYLAEMGKARSENTKAIFEKNIARGTINYSWDEVMRYFSSYSWINSNHIYEAMMRDGYFTDWKAYSKFYMDNFSIHSGVYCDIDGFSAQSAIEVIQKAQGIPVIAHPKLIQDDSQINKLLSFGLQGIEVFHPCHSMNDIEKYHKMAQHLSLAITGGSDWHRPEGRYGESIGSSGLEESEFQNFRNTLSNTL